VHFNDRSFVGFGPWVRAMKNRFRAIEQDPDAGAAPLGTLRTERNQESFDWPIQWLGTTFDRCPGSQNATQASINWRRCSRTSVRL
jgi:hypothetical protein